MGTFERRQALVRGGSVLALCVAAQLIPQAAFAQAAAAPAASEIEEVVVTGSRLTTTGFTAPTPVTTQSAEVLKQAAPTNLAEGLNQLPVFGGSTRAAQAGTGSASGGANGQNLLNLRNLGSNRNLILLDGRRLVATNQSGSVDVNIIPQNLVSRVEVVTGGASAAYGSDAVAGVVNFVLDTSFQGVKGELTGGLSSRNDAGSALASLAFGHQFMDGRVKVIASAEFSEQNGIGLTDNVGRRWYDHPAGQIPNPVTGATPGILVISDIRSSIGSNGSLITSGALRGTQFLPNGATGPFNFGSVTGASFQSGGDGALVNNGLSPDQKRWNGFGHVEFAATDNVSLYAEGSYAKSQSFAQAFVTQHVGGSGQFVIFRDNAYLPANIRTQMTTLNLQSINVGRFFTEFPVVANENTTEMKRFAAGFRADLFSNWKLDGSYSYGKTDQHLFQNNRTNLRRIYAAVDAVVNPANGQVVCRSTLAGLDPGCVPLNIFGQGAPTPAAIAYVIGDSGKDLSLTQKVAQVNLTGDLGDALQFGAGPISLAAGLEYRRESAHQTSDAVSQQILDFTGVRGFPASQNGRLGVYQSNNPQPLNGFYNVKDAYAEIGVPLLKELPFVQALDLNAAVRRTDYSQSGVVTTWKYGASWQVNDDLRLRYTRSRDIRGPNVLELFNSQTQVTQNVIYQGRGVQDLVITSGNPNLAPERATTQTYGVVYRPSWLSGFQASIDRFEIEILDAIGTVSAQNTINLCAAGNQLLCNQITVTGPNNITIRSQTLNLNAARTAGYDIEVAYARPVWNGNLTARLLATHLTQAETQAVGSAPIPTLRAATSPSWRGNLSLRYATDNWNVLVQERMLSKARIDPVLVQGVGTNHNNIPAMAYTDVSFEYKIRMMGGQQRLFLTVNNLFDMDPPVSGGNPTSFSVPADQAAYDLIGRYATAGIRFEF